MRRGTAPIRDPGLFSAPLAHTSIEPPRREPFAVLVFRASTQPEPRSIKLLFGVQFFDPLSWGIGVQN
jgi:hypothetical protein